MNAIQINAIGLEIGRLLKEKQDLQKEISKLKNKVIVIDRDIDELQEGVQEARSKM